MNGLIWKRDYEENLNRYLSENPTKKTKYQFIEELKKIERKSFLPEDREQSFNKKKTPHQLAFPIRKNPNELARLNSRLGILKKTNSNRFKKHALDKFKYNLAWIFSQAYRPSDQDHSS